MCLINKENRNKNNIIHTSGSKSFQQRSSKEVFAFYLLLFDFVLLSYCIIHLQYLITICFLFVFDVELKEEVKNLKSMLEQQAIQMAKQRRHFEEQQANQMAKQRAHYENMMMQMLSCITSQSAQSSSDH